MSKKLTALLTVLAVALWCVPAVGAGPGSGRPLVCLDPGHGGKDPGAVDHGVEEKTPNLDIAMRAKSVLQSMGYNVIMTRESDVYVSLEDRCTIANNAHASIFVSIHNNAYQEDDQGTETYCYYSSGDGRALATSIHNEVLKRIQRPNRGVKEAGFYVLKHTDMTAALLEGIFITNPEEALLIQDPAFRQKIADGVAAGVAGYLNDGGQFDEYILLLNPDPKKSAIADLTFMTGYGDRPLYQIEVPPNSRQTLRVDDVVDNADVSTMVHSKNSVPLVAERSMYFDCERGRGGSCAPGVSEPAIRWDFAEGSTAWGFSTFILVQNPGDLETRVIFDFLWPDGHTTRQENTVAAHSRFTLDCASVPGLAGADFSTRVTSTRPVICERSMYFQNHWGKQGGHVSPGVVNPGWVWYLAEGYTGGGFDTYVLIENPNSEGARALVKYMLPGGEFYTESYDMEPHSRKTIHLDELPMLKANDVSVKIECDHPVVVERSMYFDYKGITEGSNTLAAPEPSKEWYLAEGCTGNGFDTYVLMLNPGDADTETILRFYLPGGVTKSMGAFVPAHSRKTIWLNQVPGLETAQVATYITSDQPIVVERSMYFQLGAKSGGHSAMGSAKPSADWYFAEGCTR